MGLGFDAELLVPKEEDVSLAERFRRVNTWCVVHGMENAICVSIHFNAYGNGSVWTSPSLRHTTDIPLQEKCPQAAIILAVDSFF